MVYVDPKDIGYEPYYSKWIIKWNKFEALHEALIELFGKYIHPIINLIFEGIENEE